MRLFVAYPLPFPYASGTIVLIQRQPTKRLSENLKIWGSVHRVLAVDARETRASSNFSDRL